MQKQNKGPFGEIKLNVIGSSSFSHPFLWHWIFKSFSISSVLKYQKWINPFFDSLFTLLSYNIALKIGLARHESLVIVALYLFTPMWFSQLSHGPRIFSLTPRLFSEILTNLFYIITIIPLGLSYWVAITVGAFTSCMVIVSTKFGVQAIFFLTPVISILLNDPKPIFSIIFGTLLSVAISRGRIFYALKEQYLHLLNYYKKNKDGKMPVSKRNRINTLLESLDNHYGFIKKSMVVFRRMLFENSYTGVLFKMPIIMFTLLIFFIYLDQPPNSEINTFFRPVVGAFFVYLIINIPQFLFLGEAERYLNHVAFFIVVSCFLVLKRADFDWLIYLSISYGLVYWIFESFFLHKIMPDNLKIRRKSDSIIEFLQKKQEQKVILSYPYHAVGYYRIMLETKHKVICADLDREQGTRSKNNWYDNKYPYVNLNVLDRIHNKLGLDIVIIDNKELESIRSEWRPSSLWKKNKIGDPFFSIYELNE